MELDGQGPLPVDLRAELLGSEGVWGVRLEHEVDAVGAARELQRAFGFSARAALDMARAASGLVFRGTRAEADWLRLCCERSGLQVHVEGPVADVSPHELPPSRP